MLAPQIAMSAVCDSATSYQVSPGRKKNCTPFPTFCIENKTVRTGMQSPSIIGETNHDCGRIFQEQDCILLLTFIQRYHEKGVPMICNTVFDLPDVPSTILHGHHQASQLLSYQTKAVRNWLRAEEAEICNACLPENVRSVWNIGTGLGRIERLVAPLVERIVGVEIDPVVFEYCNQRLATDGYSDRFELILGDASRMPYLEDESMDLVVSAFNTCGVMPEETEKAVIQEVQRVLRPGGTFFHSVWSHEALDLQTENYRYLRSCSDGDFWETETRPNRIINGKNWQSRRYTEQQLENCLKEQFQSVSIVCFEKTALFGKAVK